MINNTISVMLLHVTFDSCMSSAFSSHGSTHLQDMVAAANVTGKLKL